MNAAATLTASVILLGLIAHTLQLKMMMPKEFARCRRNDTKIDLCLRRAIQKAIPVLVRGLPRLNILSIDPMEVKRVNIVQDHGPINIALNLTNFNGRNLRNARVKKVRSDVSNYFFEGDVDVPGTLAVSGEYRVNGNVFVLPIRGDGNFTFWIDNIRSHMKIIGERRNRKEVEYMHVNKFLIDFDIDRLSMKVDNLFDGDKVLGNYANEFLNQYAMDIFVQMKPIIHKTVGLVFQEIATRFYDQVPYQQIYL